MIINDNSCKEFFSNWYNEVTMYTNTKLSLVNYLFENNVDVVGLQELTKKDVDIIKNVFTENEYSVTFNETQQCPGYSTVGCIICKL
jgi:exonuclease III